MSKQLTRRAALELFGFAVAGSLVAACSPAPAASTAPPAAPTALAGVAQSATGGSATAVVGATTVSSSAAAQPAGAQPKTGGTLRIADMDLPRLDGHLIYTNGINISWIPYDRLVQYDDKMQPQPMLAESFDVASDATQIRFTLRKGVQFHSGRELTSDDVKWNLLRVRDPKLGVAQLATQSAWFTSIETPDKYTVVLKTEQPRPFNVRFLRVLQHPRPGEQAGARWRFESRRHRPFYLAGISSGRKRPAGEERQLLAQRSALPERASISRSCRTSRRRSLPSKQASST